MKPRFSIIVPTFNRADTILETLNSCLAQSLADLQVVVVDDGSSDDTLAVLKQVDDDRLVVVSQENAGPAAARNHGMSVAHGQYIAFLDSDDTWYPEFLASVQDTLQTHGESVVYGQIIVDRGVGRYWVKPERALSADESIYDFLYINGGFIQTSTLVIPTALRDRVQWDESVTFGDNDQFAIDCWRTGINFVMLPQPLTLYADALSADALSQLPIHAGNSEKYTNFFRWMATQKPYMSDQAWAGFQARFASVALARTAPVDSIALLWKARRAGAMSWPGVLRQCIQNHFPRAYRRLIDLYVKHKGQTLDQIRQ